MNEEDHIRLRGFFAVFAERVLGLPGAVAKLEAVEREAPKRAATALRLAVRDCLELSAAFRPSEIHAADEALTARGLPTLSQVRAAHWKRAGVVLGRGVIRGEAERLAVQAMADSDIDAVMRARCAAMLQRFQRRALKRRTAR